MPTWPDALHRVRGWVVQDWPIKLTALVLASVLWVVTTTQEPTTQVVPVVIQVDPPEGRALQQSLPDVRALFAGSGNELIKLYAQPPTIRKQVPDTAGSAYTLELNPNDLVWRQDADVRPQDVQPRIITVQLDEVAQRTVPVIHRVSIRPDSGYAQFGGVIVQPNSLLVRGPEARVRALEVLYTVPLSISGVQQSIRRAVAIDTAGLAPVRVSRNQVQVMADVGPVAQRLLTGVPVQVRGDRGSQWTATPESVTVTLRGPTARVTQLTADSITVVALAQGRTGEQTTTLTIITPPGIRATATPDSVVIRRRRG